MRNIQQVTLISYHIKISVQYHLHMDAGNYNYMTRFIKMNTNGFWSCQME